MAKETIVARTWWKIKQGRTPVEIYRWLRQTARKLRVDDHRSFMVDTLTGVRAIRR